MNTLFYARIIFYISALGSTLASAAYSPQAGIEGSEAVRLNDPRIMYWADGYENYQPGADVEFLWQIVENGLGAAEGLFEPVVSLGRGGQLTLTFSTPIVDGSGPDFAIYENGFGSGTRAFLELAFVEVSSDGINFARFANDSITEKSVGAFGASMDAAKISGLAGKMIAGYGTPFDLQDLSLPKRSLIDTKNIRYVRLIDVVGGQSRDSSGDIIYDPFPTTGSAGFDLDGIAVLHHEIQPLLKASAEGFLLEWSVQKAQENFLKLEVSFDAKNWNPVVLLNGKDGFERFEEGQTIQNRYAFDGTAWFRFRWINAAAE